MTDTSQKFTLYAVTRKRSHQDDEEETTRLAKCPHLNVVRRIPVRHATHCLGFDPNFKIEDRTWLRFRTIDQTFYALKWYPSAFVDPYEIVPNLIVMLITRQGKLRYYVRKNNEMWSKYRVNISATSKDSLDNEYFNERSRTFYNASEWTSLEASIAHLRNYLDRYINYALCPDKISMGNYMLYWEFPKIACHHCAGALYQSPVLFRCSMNWSVNFLGSQFGTLQIKRTMLMLGIKSYIEDQIKPHSMFDPGPHPEFAMELMHKNVFFGMYVCDFCQRLRAKCFAYFIMYKGAIKESPSHAQLNGFSHEKDEAFLLPLYD